ncbi:unnamed protein product [Prunus armeniaca]
MADDIGRDAGHIVVKPGEDFCVRAKESDEFETEYDSRGVAFADSLVAEILCGELAEKHVWREYSLHSGKRRSADDGVVCRWAIDYQKMGVDNRSSRGGANGKWELDTSDWLNNITQET